MAKRRAPKRKVAKEGEAPVVAAAEERASAEPSAREKAPADAAASGGVDTEEGDLEAIWNDGGDEEPREVIKLVSGYGSDDESEGDDTRQAAGEGGAARQGAGEEGRGPAGEAGPARIGIEGSAAPEGGGGRALAASRSLPDGFPSAASILSEVEVPGFLRPEAIAPLAATPARRDAPAAPVAPAAKVRAHGDVSRLAPALPGSQRADPSVVSGRAARAEGGGDAPAATARAIALLGGETANLGNETGRAQAASRAMPVDTFLDRPGAQLPRKRGERKDREKEKRSKGQSAIGTWKSEAEMALRQQYD